MVHYHKFTIFDVKLKLHINDVNERDSPIVCESSRAIFVYGSIDNKEQNNKVRECSSYLFYGGCSAQLNTGVSIATNSKDNKIYLIYYYNNRKVCKCLIINKLENRKSDRL